MRHFFYDSLKRILFAFVAMMFVVPAFSATLPAGYTELSYVDMNAGSYLLTDLVPTSDSKIEMDFQTTTTVASPVTYLGGTTGNANGLRFAHITNKSFRFYAFGGTTDSTATVQDNTRYKYVFNNNVITLTSNDTTVFTNALTGTGTTNVPLALNGYNTNGTISQNLEGIYLYSFKMWNASGQLVANYVPAKQGNTVGFYDTVSDSFKTATAGAFTAGPIIQSCPNFYDKDTMTVKNITLVSLPEIETGNGSATVIVPIKSNQKYTVAIIGGPSISLWRAGTAPDGTPPTTATSYQKLTSYQPITLTSGAFDKYLYIQFSSTYASQVLSNLMVVEGEVAPTTYAEYDASICTPNTIKIATTKYTEDAFAGLMTTLSEAITKVTNIVDTTVQQATEIGELAQTKQDRPDTDCPAGRKCLLIMGADNKPHWYLIQE